MTHLHWTSLDLSARMMNLVKLLPVCLPSPLYRSPSFYIYRAMLHLLLLMMTVSLILPHRTQALQSQSQRGSFTAKKARGTAFDSWTNLCRLPVQCLWDVQAAHHQGQRCLLLSVHLMLASRQIGVDHQIRTIQPFAETSADYAFPRRDCSDSVRGPQKGGKQTPLICVICVSIQEGEACFQQQRPSSPVHVDFA